MKITKKGVGVFLLSLTIAFVLIGGIFMLFYKYIQTVGVSDGKKDVPYKADTKNNQYIPKKEESMNLLLIGCEEIHLAPKMMMVITYNAVEGELMLTPLPPSAVATVGVREDTLSGHYDYEGIRGGVNAVKSLLVTDIDRYARLDKAGIADLIDFLGGIECELKAGVVCTYEDGSTEVLSRGKQLLDGRRAAALMLCNSAQYSSTEDEYEKNSLILRQGELSSRLLRQRMNSRLCGKLPDLIQAFFYNAETNLNQYDFAIRQKGLDKLLDEHRLTIVLNSLKGEQVKDYSSNNFVPDNQSIRELSRILSSIYE